MKALSSKFSGELCGIYIDMGTTNTRVWLMRGLKVIAFSQARVGVADSARTGSQETISNGLKRLIAEVRETKTGERHHEPTFCIAAGMITSALGLAEIPHLPAPAGKAELSATLRSFQFPEISALPFLLVPGIRSGEDSEIRVPMTTDAMRGEETLCVGLLESGLLTPGSTLLNLGSHWKAIHLDEQGRISSSITSLSGELLHAAQTQTLLASTVPSSWPDQLAPEWAQAGIDEQMKSGLARALFCVRLLAHNFHTSSENCFAFLCGAFIGADLQNLFARNVFKTNCRVVIAGNKTLGAAWQQALSRASISARLLADEERERAFLAGLHGFATKIFQS